MRTKNSLKNVIAALTLSVVAIVFGLVAQKVFVDTLGLEYLGLNGLFTSLISALGIVELGLGAAVIYHLYKPFAEGDKQRIKTLLAFYKKGYRVIAAIVALIGLLLVPFLGMIVGQVNISVNIYVVFALFLIDIICTYLLAYKRSILYADEKNHLISTIHIAYLIVLNTAQVILLVTTKNFYFYLIAKIIVQIIENLATQMLVNRRYPYLTTGETVPLDSETKKDVFQKLRALFLHKLAEFAVLGTDNLVISLFLGLAAVGLTSNYLLIVTAITSVVWQMFESVTASVGNLLTTGSKKEAYQAYRRIRFANIWISSVVSIGLFVVADQFVRVWLGSSFVLPLDVVAALSVNLFLMLTRSTINSFKEAAGIFYQDRYVPVIESIINIVLSIFFLHFFGLAGVFMGTICSNLLLHLYSYPKYVYTQLFDRSYSNYYKEFAASIAVAFLIGGASFAISQMIHVTHPFLQLMLLIVSTLIVTNASLFILFSRNREFHYYRQLVARIFRTAKRAGLKRVQE